MITVRSMGIETGGFDTVEDAQRFLADESPRDLSASITLTGKDLLLPVMQ